MSGWGFEDIPDQSGRVAVVTGANSGIGFETARMLAQRGADVVLACRSAERARSAVERIRAARPIGAVSFFPLDLSNLDSVAAFAEELARTHDRLDLLVNNAGVMVPPLGRTAQGFELQFGTNHLGHFALTARLLPMLERTEGSRIVVVASTAQLAGRIALDDLNWEKRRYVAWLAYGQSKLANMMFALELERRLRHAGSHVHVTAAHPGWTSTDLQRTAGLAKVFSPLFAMKPEGGALPTLRAATDPSAEGGSYWGPNRVFELWGSPTRARVPEIARNEAIAAALFDASERLVGLTFPRAAG